MGKWTGALESMVDNMKLAEYNGKLDEISRALDVDGVDEKLLEQLEDMYNYKPVSPRWHQLKCKALMMQGEISGIIAGFEDKVSKEYIYDGNIELWSQIIEAYKLNGNIMEGTRQEFMLSRLTGSKYHTELTEELTSVRQQFAEGDESKETVEQLEQLYYKTCNRMMAYVVYMYGMHLYPDYMDDERQKIYQNTNNMAYIGEYILRKKTVIIIADREDKLDYDILSYMLHGLGLKVYMICDVLTLEEDFELKASVGVSVDNMQQYEDCMALTAIEKVKDGVCVGDNIPFLVDYICKNETENDYAITFATNRILDRLRFHEDISKRFERLSQYEAEYVEDEIGFGRAGDYCEYISGLYGENARELIYREPQVDFSIVVPVRNATETLYHTLKTCIEQSYKGTYEILVSDNSVGDHTKAYETCVNLNDDHIRYIKTPRDLNLTKSFEYAYLNAKGKHIVAIGADDAVFPWTLEVLSVVWGAKAHNNRYVVVWDRGFYAWPGFNGGQQHQLVVNGGYTRGNVTIKMEKSSDYLSIIEKNPQVMYTLPNTYINSAFSRDYLGYLYEKTGCILDGFSQDVYMGLTNIALCEDVLRIKYPLSIAGMSSASVGTVRVKADEGNNEKQKENLKVILGGKGFCSFVMGSEVAALPVLGTDASGMYNCIYRLRAKNILPEGADNVQRLKDTYLNMYQSTNILSDKCFGNVLIGYEKVKEIGKELANWYEEKVLPFISDLKYITPEFIKKQHEKKRYEEGAIASGGMMVDASKYGVTNIYEAVQLYKKLSNL